MTKKLECPWVSEWRVERTDKSWGKFKWKVTDGCVYSPTYTKDDAEKMRQHNILQEIQGFIMKHRICSICDKMISEHSPRDFENCVLSISTIRGERQ